MAVQNGARFELKLRAQGDTGANYAVEIRDALGRWALDAHIDGATGAVALSNPTPPPPAPPWAASYLTSLLRSLWRQRNRHPDRPWPRRVTRWRGGPEERS